MHLHRNGLIQSGRELKRVAEIGPGDSLGTGMAALYSGAEQYTAMDILRHAGKEINRKVNDALLHMFLAREEIPHRSFPDLSPALPGYNFPQSLLPACDEQYSETYQLISRALHDPLQADTAIRYRVPWMDTDNWVDGETDLIFSQAAMEHVADIDKAYRLMNRMLRRGGIISHQVDFRAHEMTDTWDGHFYIGQRTWQILEHGRKYPMNRLPFSAHLHVMQDAGFRVVAVEKVTGICTQTGRHPAVPDISFLPDDLITMGALFQAVKI